MTSYQYRFVAKLVIWVERFTTLIDLEVGYLSMYVPIRVKWYSFFSKFKSFHFVSESTILFLHFSIFLIVNCIKINGALIIQHHISNVVYKNDSMGFSYCLVRTKVNTLVRT